MAPNQQEIVAAIPRLRRLAVSLCRDRGAADDLVQDTAERALSRLQQFGGGNLRGWLATIMLNLFRNQRRAFARRPVLVDIDDPAVRGRLSTPATSGDALDIVRALDLLPEEQRVTLLLRTLEDLSYAEIAEAQGVPIGTVMSRLARARETIRSFAEGDNVIPLGRTK